MGQVVNIRSGYVKNIIADGTTGTSTGAWAYKDAPFSAFQVVSSAAATVVIEVSNDGINAVATPLGTVTLPGAGSDGFATQAPWKYVRARITANSGTVNVLMSV